MNAFTCNLPGGYLDARGKLHREAELVPLGGTEEELLAGGGPRAELVTAVLARCVRRLGDVAPVTPAVARELLVADRQYLLLELRAATFGDRVHGLAACPWPGCGERVDVEFVLSAVPVRRLESRPAEYALRLSGAEPDGDGDRAADAGPEIRFRLPNGGDEERLAALVEENEAAALTALLERCVTGIDGRSAPPAAEIAALSPRARQEIETEMEARAPSLGLEMAIRCPACERRFTLPFEIPDFFFGELAIGLDLLYREVHYLAYHYSWSEAEILAMPRDKRRAYIDVLADEIEKLNHAV